VIRQTLKALLLLLFASAALAEDPPKKTDNLTEPTKPKLEMIGQLPDRKTSLWLYSGTIVHRNDGWIYAGFHLGPLEDGSGDQVYVAFDCPGKRAQFVGHAKISAEGTVVGAPTSTELSP
jgi:hypothetical protein